MQKILLSLLILFSVSVSFAQPERWQQHIKYNINVQMDVDNNRFAGTEKIEYINNSPDTLNRVFFHLYWNAFQPNSSMDIRSREAGKTVLRIDRDGNPVHDWDSRVTNRISKLKENEIGYQHVKSIVVEGKEQELIEHETILEVKLDKPILPKSTTVMNVAFEAQVPVQIRRSGRDNAEGVRYSMSQWYPKMVEYDYQGWNANPYIAREFYGVWGDYDVKITIDKKYMVAATGVLQNANQIGYGYESTNVKPAQVSGKTITWNFTGQNIHDFVWAADTSYRHISKKAANGVMLNVFYKAGNSATDSAWNNVLWAAEKILPYMESRFGKYPYPQYSFIQGGDGGMEYAMATLLKGPGLGAAFHEWMHSWYQHVLGTNESLFAWMDEGFANYAEAEVTAYYNNNFALQSPYISEAEKSSLQKDIADNKVELPLNQSDNYAGYFALARSPYEEPLTTHADHFNTNFGYSLGVYSKGSVFLTQLGYIVGDKTRDEILREYYRVWGFKHPNANDFIRIAEKVSGITLQWYKEYWIYTTKTIEYSLGDVTTDSLTEKTLITVRRLGKMPMPIEVLMTYKDGSKELHYIPLDLMYGNKAAEDSTPRIIHKEWKWVQPTYTFETSRKVGEIKSIEIDPSQRMADIKRNNNRLVVPE